jgi:hypothetical protein
MTLCIPLTPLPAAVVQQPSRTASTQPGSTWPGKDRSGLWLRNAAAGLCVLAAAAAAVSFTAQYRMVDATRHLTVVAALEASIPDAAALVFACLGIALALNGRRALRPRALNLASVGASVFMNAIAAAPGWRNLAIWAMPPVAYALASDTLIGLHPGRVPRLGPGRMPGRSRPPRSCPAGPLTASVEGDQDRPVPFFGHRTTRPARLHPP